MTTHITINGIDTPNNMEWSKMKTTNNVHAQLDKYTNLLQLAQMAMSHQCIDDCGTSYHNVMIPTFGNVTIIIPHPTKPLGINQSWIVEWFNAKYNYYVQCIDFGTYIPNNTIHHVLLGILMDVIGKIMDMMGL